MSYINTSRQKMYFILYSVMYLIKCDQPDIALHCIGQSEWYNIGVKVKITVGCYSVKFYDMHVFEYLVLFVDEICGYTVYKSNSAPIPFQVLLVDRKTGSAKIVLAKGNQLNHEATKSYEFEIAADDCITGAHSVRLALSASLMCS